MSELINKTVEQVLSLPSKLDKTPLAEMLDKHLADIAKQPKKEKDPVGATMDIAIKELKDPRSHNIGRADYAKHKIQPWDIWKEYRLNPWTADIIKRVLRDKTEGDLRLDFEKIKHICDECIRQIDAGEYTNHI